VDVFFHGAAPEQAAFYSEGRCRLQAPAPG
jgi:hypothetical protein